MTEEEAKQKWCPMFQGWKSNAPGDSDHYKCKGSACMMWRQTYSGEMTKDGYKETGTGYCGLANSDRPLRANW